MAFLENKVTGESLCLHSAHIFGRNTDICNTHISDKDVSRLHATISWVNTSWVLEDHSRNGTYVNEALLIKSSITLNEGSTIQFGKMNAANWELVDAKPPCSYLRSLSEKDQVIILDDYRSISADDGRILVFYKLNGYWTTETEGKRFQLYEGWRIKVNGKEWEFIDNEALLTDTPDYGQMIRNAWFKFCVSQNEEDIRLKLIANGDEYDLGRRTYNTLLLTLARKRLSDMDLGFVADDQGWVSMERLEKEVSKELGRTADLYYLNLQIYRFRKQLMEIKPLGCFLSDIIDRRMGELRFAFPQLKIFKGNVCIGEIMENTQKAGSFSF